MAKEKKNKVNLASLSDLKNATDDEIVKILTDGGYQQTFSLVDVRLGLGFLSVAVAGAVGAYDYVIGFDKAKNWTTFGVAIYLALNILLTLWIVRVEKGVFFQGFKGNAKITVSSSITKYVPVYELVVKSESPESTSELKSTRKPFNEFFNTDGFIVREPLTEWISQYVNIEGDKSEQKKKK
ncbi:signal peptidase complex subunit 2 [Dipodascopsis uninucleata]